MPFTNPLFSLDLLKTGGNIALESFNNNAVTKETPTKAGREGDTTTTQGKNAIGKDIAVFWRHNGKEWVQISKDEYQEATGEGYASVYTPKSDSVSSAVRYPADISIGSDSDYVIFEFYEYQPPFQNQRVKIDKTAGQQVGDFFRDGTLLGGVEKVGKLLGITEGQDYSKEQLALYNRSATDEAFYTKTSKPTVVLYMPEDISTGYKANWTGKKFTTLGANMLKTAGSGNPLSGLDNAAATFKKGLDQVIPQGTNKVIRDTIGKITGESIEADDIFSSTRGVIQNPNVELLFGGVDLRNFQLRYKLVPRNYPEGLNIKQIINTFRAAMLPDFAKGNEIIFSGNESVTQSFIRVPNVCKVSFMRGGQLNTDVPQYKMCAITQVDVNYTPDGSYAILENGEMVAYEITLSFQETKLIFASEVEKY